MMRSYSQFPKKIDTSSANSYLKSCLILEGYNEREALPTMEEIVDMCTGRPRLLRVRHSPLEMLHNPKLPTLAVHSWYLYNALDYLENSLFVLFEDWKNDYKSSKNDTDALFFQYVQNIHQCYKEVGILFRIPIPLSSALASPELKQSVKRSSLSLIHSMIPATFHEACTAYFKTQLGKFLVTQYPFHPHYRSRNPLIQVQKILDDQLMELESVRCVSNKVIAEALESQTIDVMEEDFESEEKTEEFEAICRQLNQLELIEDWTEIVKDVIEQKLQNLSIKEDWTISIVQVMLKWLHIFILPWISYITSKDETDKDWYNFLREKIKAEHILYELIYRIRVRDIFDIIREYPASKPAIVDFHVKIRDRLLHLGASLQDILTQYEACVTCLSIIDPTCEILEPTIKLIKNYLLKQRNYRLDVLQGIVNQVRDRLDEDPTDTSQLYVFKKSFINDEEVPHALDDLDKDKPARLDRLCIKVKDPIAMLISLCKSLKDFIDGYSNVLCNSLMIAQYDIDTEVRRLELLKRHFPVDSFLRCDIMLKDVENSRRLDRQLHETGTFVFPLHSTMITSNYWIAPSDSENEDDDDNDNDKVNLGIFDGLEDTIESYKEKYKHVKASRRLNFMPIKGMVTLDLEFENRTVRVVATPDAALVIAVFETKEQLFTSEQIATRVGMKKSQVIKCLKFWIEKKILELTARGEYHLIED
ncbi:uncharacterized protein BX663DRAFT_556546 [Cokeromyces recurvatus]|uniref:uncharacterized protein n=1 Tax=Cokeromyces recurvatus TaxID=90255 RepID=UPI00221E7CE8|nr:uncharacterized protein BX663DRAFT_556546 [Cokeromyces recurvatus]KAI7897591.1 hypothetical protein BX663DRAFT_556546 [Cokeromyces recurvatus]